MALFGGIGGQPPGVHRANRLPQATSTQGSGDPDLVASVVIETPATSTTPLVASRSEGFSPSLRVLSWWSGPDHAWPRYRGFAYSFSGLADPSPTSRRFSAQCGAIGWKNGPPGLDRADMRVLQALMRDGRAPDVALAEEVHLSSTAVARRRRLLEEKGFIAGYTALLDRKRLGFSAMVMVLFELASQAEQCLKEFEQAVLSCPSMVYSGFISGENDFMMLIAVRSLDDYDRVLRTELSSLPHVARVRSSFVLHEVANRPIAPAVLGLER